ADRRGPATAASGPGHGWPVVFAKPALPDLFDGHGKLITRPGVLVRHLAEHRLSGEGAEPGEAQLPEFDGYAPSKWLDPARFRPSCGHRICWLPSHPGLCPSRRPGVVSANLRQTHPWLKSVSHIGPDRAVGRLSTDGWVLAASIRPGQDQRR